MTKSQDYKDGYSDGFCYAWKLIDEQTKIANEVNEQEIKRLQRLLKANGLQPVVSADTILKGTD